MQQYFTRLLTLALFLASAPLSGDEEKKAAVYTAKVSSLGIPAHVFGPDWIGPSGLVIDDFKDLNNCPIEVIPVVMAISKLYTPIGVRGCADFTYRKKANPFHQVTLRVFRVRFAEVLHQLVSQEVRV